jgi:hypothetical protein
MLRKYAATEILSATMAPMGAKALARYAHRHQFAYEPRPGYLYVRSRAISSRTNDNFDTFPAEEIEKSYASFVGKPVFVNHNNDNHHRARGVVIDAALHRDRNPDGSPDTWVEVLMEVDAIRFPKLAAAIVAGHIDRTSMGTDVAYSLCSFCGNKATTPLEYCAHIPKMKGQRIYRTTASGKKEGVLVSEICHGLKFFENSLLVEEPADPTAFFLGVEGHGVQKAASKTAGWSQARHPEPIVHVMGTRPPRPLQTGDTLMHPDSGYTTKIVGHSPSLLMVDGRSMPMHRAPMEGDHSNSIIGESVEDHDEARRKLDEVGTPQERDFLKSNPTGPSRYSHKVAHETGDDHIHLSDAARQEMIDASNAGKNYADMQAHYQKTPVNTHDHSDLLAHMLTAHEGHDSLQHYTHQELLDEHGQEHDDYHEDWPNAVHMDGHHFHEAKRLPAGKPPVTRPIKPKTALEVYGERFSHYSEGINSVNDAHDEGFAHLTDGGMHHAHCCDGHASRYPGSEPCEGLSFSELRTKMPHGSTCDECMDEITQSRQHTARECEYGEECPHFDPEEHASHYREPHEMKQHMLLKGIDVYHKPEVGHLPENHPLNDHFGTDDDLHAEQHEQNHWEDTYHSRKAAEGDVGSQINDLFKGHPGHDMLRTNPHGPTFHSKRITPRLAYGEQMAPADVDTLRDEECPVCGEADAYDGNECQVCGFIAPPKMFMDPDLDAAKQQDLRGEMQQEMLADPNGDGMPDVIPGSGNPGTDAPPMDAEQVPDPDDVAQQQVNQIVDEQDPLQPEELDENGQPIMQANPMQQEMPGDPNAEPMLPEDVAGDDGQGAPGTPNDGVADLTCPACGYVADASAPQSVDMDTPMADPAAAASTEGALCPQCGQAPLVSIKQVQESMTQLSSLFPVIRL